MAVKFYTSDAKALLAKFDAAIRQNEPKGKITTWEVSSDGKYYTHKAKDWAKLAWFKPEVFTDHLTFNIIKPKERNVTQAVYSYYHGHLIETFINHFNRSFTYGVATALAQSTEKCS